MVSAHSASSHMDGRSQGFLTDTTLHTEGTLLSGVAHKFESLQSQLAWDEQRARVEVQHAAKFANAGAQDGRTFTPAIPTRPTVSCSHYWADACTSHTFVWVQLGGTSVENACTLSSTAQDICR